MSVFILLFGLALLILNLVFLFQVVQAFINVCEANDILTGFVSHGFWGTIVALSFVLIIYAVLYRVLYFVTKGISLGIVSAMTKTEEETGYDGGAQRRAILYPRIVYVVRVILSIILTTALLSYFSNNPELSEFFGSGSLLVALMTFLVILSLSPLKDRKPRVKNVPETEEV